MNTQPSIVAMTAPVVLGLGTFAAIVLTDGTEDLNWIRFTIAALAFFAVTWVSAYVVPVTMTKRRLAKEDAVHRKAVVSAFRADVERITGRPFPDAPTAEK